MAIAEHPRVGSRLIHHQGKHWFHLNSAEISVRLIHVTPDVLLTESPPQWQHVCETMTPQHIRGAALFEACLLVSSDPSAGCVLVAGKSCLQSMRPVQVTCAVIDLWLVLLSG
jgi:hypothetical protein